MCRSVGPKPIVVFKERSVPAPLKYLHYRLLDESIQHRRNAQLAHSTVRLRDFHPLHRLWSVGSAQDLFPADWPVQFSRSQTSSIHCSVVGLSTLRFANSDSVPPSLSLEFETDSSSPGVSSTAFDAQPLDLHSVPLMDEGFAASGQLPRTLLASHPVLVHRLAFCSMLLSDLT